MAYDGQDLWHHRSDNMFNNADTTYKISLTTKNVVDYFKPHGSGVMPTGLAFDGRYLWSYETTEDLIYKIDTSTFEAIDTLFSPCDKGTSLTFDGNYLWLMDDDDTHLIYQIDISNTSGYANSILDNESINNENGIIIKYANDRIEVILIDSKLSVAVEMFSINGKSLDRKEMINSKNIGFDMGEYPSGIYVINTLVGGEAYSCKIVKP